MSFISWKNLAAIYPLLRENPFSSLLLRQETDALKSLLRPVLNDSLEIVCDIGSGRGHSLNLLPETAKIRFAVDNCSDMINLSRDQFNDVFFLESDAHFLPFRPDAFDLIVCVGLVEYLPDIDPLLSQFNCILKPDRYLVITSSPQNFITYSRYLLGPKLYPGNSDKFESVLKNHCFKIIKKRSTISQHQYLLQKRKL